MSRHFELLQRVAKDDCFIFPGAPAFPPGRAPFAVPARKATPDAEIANLVQRLFPQSGAGSEPRVVSFSGMRREDRSSWICARAAEALAEQAGGSVCVVDANLRSPQLHAHLAVGNRFGLAEALATEGPIRKFAAPVSGANLWLIAAGRGKPGIATFMESYRERFAELRETFDYVLISSPALSRGSDAVFVGQLADGIVLIVEANHTRRETLRRAKEQLESAQVRLLGAVLDQRTFPIPEKLYRWL
jgi:Mrp family chromosome partitioning ATPase